MNTGVDQQWRQLQQLYDAMSNSELLKLHRERDGLTAVAQQAVDAAISARGLRAADAVPSVQAMPDLNAAEDDPSLVELTTFQIAVDAEQALHALDEQGIPVRMEPAMRRMTEDDPKIKTNWLTIFVEKARQQDAVRVLRDRMGLFPVPIERSPLEEEVVYGGDAEETPFFVVGEFETDADIALARKALADANIRFNASKEADEAGSVSTTIEVRLEDMERALEVVEAAFGEEG
ncbi:MAG: hypothetical protein M3R43_07705 [Acidobacteriota bacterium]|nr:hypothetical protein [Acidobacteriota bacterium]